MSDPTEIDDDHFLYEGGMRQCISGFGDNAKEQIEHLLNHPYSETGNKYAAMMRREQARCHRQATDWPTDSVMREVWERETADWQAAAEAFEALVEACCLFRAWCRPPESGEPTLPKTLVAVDVALKKAGVE